MSLVNSGKFVAGIAIRKTSLGDSLSIPQIVLQGLSHSRYGVPAVDNKD